MGAPSPQFTSHKPAFPKTTKEQVQITLVMCTFKSHCSQKVHSTSFKICPAPRMRSPCAAHNSKRKVLNLLDLRETWNTIGNKGWPPSKGIFCSKESVCKEAGASYYRWPNPQGRMMENVCFSWLFCMAGSKPTREPPNNPNGIETWFGQMYDRGRRTPIIINIIIMSCLHRSRSKTHGGTI